MATRAIMIQWGIPVAGRERMALEEFASYMQWVNQLKTEGKIERFEVFGPRTGNQELFSGFSIIEGEADKIAAIAESDDFRKRVIRCMTAVQNTTTVECDTGAAMAERMQLYSAALKDIGL